MMTFGLVVLSNCSVWPSAPKWCLHFLDGSKPGKGGPSLGFANIGVTSR